MLSKRYVSKTVFLSLIVSASLSAEMISLKEMANRWKGKARTAATEGKWAEAEPLLKKALLAAPMDRDAIHLHAYVLFKTEQYPAAAGKYHELLLKQPDSFATNFHLGQCLYQMKFYALSVQAFE
jgi:predicted Zn-dependent protease